MADTARLREALSTLSPSQITAVRMLTEGASQTQAAEAAGCTRETLSRWLTHHPGVRVALVEAQIALMSEHALAAARVRTRATEAAGRALTVLMDRLDADDPDTDPIAVLRAVAPLTSAPPPLLVLDPDSLIDSEMKRLRQIALSSLDVMLDTDGHHELALRRLATSAEIDV